MPVLNSQAVADRYPDNTPGAILQQVYNSRGGWLSVSAAAVFCQLQYGEQGSSHWTEEVQLGNGAFVQLDPKCTGVRFRNAVSGQVALVTVQVAQGAEPPLAVVALGSVTVTGLSLTFQKNGVAQGSEPILDLDDAANLFTWTLTDDVPNTRMRLTWAATDPHVLPGSVGWDAVATSAAGGGGVAGGFLDKSGRVLVTRVANSSPTYGSALTTDTQWRFQADTNGLLTWGTGAVAGDTTLGRSAAVPPSAGQVGVVTQQAFYSTNTTGGFVYAATVNNSAFLSFLAAADANPAFKIFTQGAMVWGAGGASAPDVELARISGASGNFLLLILGSGIGYGTGAGGTATAAATAVTLNKGCGQVTFTGQSNTASVSKTFTVTNSVVSATDTVIVSVNNATTAAGILHATTTVTGGSFSITLWTTTANAAVTYSFNFAVIKGATA